MEDADFSDDFCRFLQTTIPAVDAAELLLLLKRNPDSALSAAEVEALPASAFFGPVSLSPNSKTGFRTSKGSPLMASRAAASCAGSGGSAF